MVMSFLTKMFGSKNERELKKLQPTVERINALEPAMQALSDEDLRVQTGRFGADMAVALVNDGPVTFLLER